MKRAVFPFAPPGGGGAGHRRWLLAAAWLLPMFAMAATTPAPARIVALGGDITEIVYALDAQQALVGVDSTSEWPAAAKQLPDVGYVRQLSAEGVLSLRPGLVLATADAGPPQALAQLREAGVRIEQMPLSHTPDSVLDKVRRIGRVLGREDAAERLAQQLQADYATLAGRVAGMSYRPRVVFLLSAGSGSPMAAGRDTAAAHAIALAGGVDPADGFAGYKALSAEALVALAPDVIVLMDERADALGGAGGVLKLPGVAQTPAGRAHRIVFVDGQALLGFGSRNAGQELALQRELADVRP
jgi:iron complex transport system substrate-binding protein